MRALVFAVASVAVAQTLPGTRPLSLSGDPAARMVDGIHAYLDRATALSRASRHPSRARLAEILGEVDPRVDFSAPELVATTATAALLARAKTYSVYRVRWPVFEGVHAEGLLFQPNRTPAARVVAIPDADETPEESAIAPRLAAQGCQVLSLAILDRRDTYSGNPRFRMTNQPHREYLYRMAFPAGRHIIGYEVEKILAAVDWFGKQPDRVPVAVWGYGEGGLLALDAAALDSRIDVAVVSGYFGPREAMWQEPIFRNVWSFQRDFGDAEVAALIAPRKLIVETQAGPRWDGPSHADPKRTGAAPGRLEPVAREAVVREADRARELGANVDVASDALDAFCTAIHRQIRVSHEAAPKLPVPEGRARRQFDELADYTQRILRASEAVRNAYWSNRRTTQAGRDRVWNDMIGRLPPPDLPMNPRSRHAYSNLHWDGYEVTLDVFPDVFAYGVLLLPKDLKPGERRPVVVCQHGLEGRASDVAGPRADERYYRRFAVRLAEQGFITYAPQNPY
ncbi:MAG: alpha/beta hydrolase family protein, partial [Bryobacteraceae bacterium]